MHTSPMLWKLLLKERKCHNSKVFTLMKTYDCSGCFQYIQIKEDRLRFFPPHLEEEHSGNYIPTSHPTLPPHLFVSKSYKPTKCPELNAKVGNLSLTYVPAFFFSIKSWDKAAVSALARNFLAPVSIWWLQFSPFLSSHQCDLLCYPTSQFFRSHSPASRYLEALCRRSSLRQSSTISFQAWHWTAPRYTAVTKSFLLLGSPRHKLSKHYLRFQVLPYLWLKFSLFRRETE